MLLYGKNQQVAISHRRLVNIFLCILDAKAVFMQQGIYLLCIQRTVIKGMAIHLALNGAMAFPVREEKTSARAKPAGKKWIECRLMLQWDMP